MSSNLVKPKLLFSECISKVSKYVECHDSLKFEPIDGINGVFALRNATTLLIRDGHPLFYLLQVKKSKSLYLHISITLRAPYNGASQEVNHEFEGISVQFFQGKGKLFCRAEWDVKKKKDKLEHPQPHWHWCFEKQINDPVVFGSGDAETIQRDGFLQEIEEIDARMLPNVDFEELHYAMASKWTVKDSATEDFSIQKLYCWLDNCLANIIDQYNYQVNKGSFISSKKW